MSEEIVKWIPVGMGVITLVWMWIRHPPVWEHNRRNRKKRR